MARHPQHDAAEILSKVGLFRGCRRRQLLRVVRNLTTVDVASGRTLCREGEAGQGFLVVVSGTATVTIHAGTTSSVGPGGYFGEIATLDGGPCAATVTAETDMELLVASRAELNTILDELPLVAHRMLTEMASRLRLARSTTSRRGTVDATTLQPYVVHPN